MNSNSSCDNLKFDYKNEKGCDCLTYPNPETSPYVLPFPSGTSFKTGLTNCSSSYHGAGRTDQYAYDFDVNAGTKFYATRSGVVAIENSQSSSGGGSGNGVIIDHQDKTFGIYLHSPKKGILVNVGDVIKKGDLLVKVGKFGLAGYPHLHFVVVQNSYVWPYKSIPITFRNIMPTDVIVKSFTMYKVCKD